MQHSPTWCKNIYLFDSFSRNFELAFVAIIPDSSIMSISSTWCITAISLADYLVDRLTFSFAFQYFTSTLHTILSLPYSIFVIIPCSYVLLNFESCFKLLCLCLFGTILAETSVFAHAKLTSFRTKTGRSCCFVLLFCYNTLELSSSLLGFFGYFFPWGVGSVLLNPWLQNHQICFPKQLANYLLHYQFLLPLFPIASLTIVHCCMIFPLISLFPRSSFQLSRAYYVHQPEKLQNQLPHFHSTCIWYHESPATCFHILLNIDILHLPKELLDNQYHITILRMQAGMMLSCSLPLTSSS